MEKRDPDAVSASKVTIALDTVEPFEAHNIVEHTLQATETTTDVTVSITGTEGSSCTIC